MELVEAIGRRRTTNGALRAAPIKIERQQLLLEVARFLQGNGR